MWLSSKELAIKRVKIRVREGGHNIPIKIIKRRYDIGLKNLFQLYIPVVDKWFIVDNSEENFKFVAKGTKYEHYITDNDIWFFLNQKYNGN